MLLVLVAAGGVALAVTQTCTTDPCEGTSGPDTLYKRVPVSQNDFGHETIYGRGADDDLIATNDRPQPAARTCASPPSTTNKGRC